MATGVQYYALDRTNSDIRLILVKRQTLEDHSPLQCFLVQRDLAEEPLLQFVAVSYTWGTGTETQPITINDSIASVPESTDSALRYLHLTFDYCIEVNNEPYTPVWIDAICINQQDLPERSDQVKLMGDIYSKAELVCIWLGTDHTNDASIAVQSFQTFLEHATDEQGQLKLSDTKRLTKALEKISPEESKALDSFYASPWFTRMWIIQEAILAKNAVCVRGIYCIDLRLVIWLPAVFDHLRILLHPTESNLAGLQGRRNAAALAQLSLPSASRALSALLELTGSFDATNPRDKIYGFLGLLNDGIPAEIIVDYSQTAYAVYSQATRCAIKQDKNLKILREALAREPGTASEYDSLPSWAVRCNTKERSERPNLRPFFEDKDAGQDLFAYADTNQAHVLRVKGYILDVIDSEPFTILEKWNPEQSREVLENDLHTLQRILSLLQTSYPNATEDDIEHTLRQILSMENPDAIDRFLSFGRPSFGEFVRIARGRTLSDATEYIWNYGQTLPGLLNCFHTCTAARKFFQTTARRVGSAWPSAQKGDYICHLFGCDAPLILRQHGESWSLIGDAYVYGAMRVG